MASPPSPSSPLQDADAQPQPKPICSILFVVAMQAEALPLVEALKLEQDDGSLFPSGLPWLRYHGIREGLDISVVVPGKCMIFGVDNVGTVPSSLLTYAAVQALRPDLIINMGTAGGFKGKGAKLADAYIATEAAHHDRRIPIPIFDKYGIGANWTLPTPNLVQTLQLKEGKLSTGNSLDMTSQDEELIKANDATIKDMEEIDALPVAAGEAAVGGALLVEGLLITGGTYEDVPVKSCCKRFMNHCRAFRRDMSKLLTFEACSSKCAHTNSLLRLPIPNCFLSSQVIPMDIEGMTGLVVS